MPKEVIRTYGTSDKEPMKHVIAELNKLQADNVALNARVAEARTLANEAKADLNLARADLLALQTRVTEARTLANESKLDHNALLAKLDADVGVTDVNYAALHTTAAADVAAVAAITATDVVAADVAAVAAVTADTLTVL